MNCLNCNTPTTFQNQYCSTTCAEIDRRSQAAGKALDERLERDKLPQIPPISVLSDADRETVRLAQTWVRHLYQGLKETRRDEPRYSFRRLDRMECDGLSELGDRLTDLLVRTSGEPQLFVNSNIGGDGGR